MYHPILKKKGTSDGLLLGNALLSEMKECEENEKLRAKARSKNRYFKKKYGHFKRKGRHGGIYLQLIDDYHVSEHQDPLRACLGKIFCLNSTYCRYTKSIE